MLLLNYEITLKRWEITQVLCRDALLKIDPTFQLQYAQREPNWLWNIQFKRKYFLIWYGSGGKNSSRKVVCHVHTGLFRSYCVTRSGLMSWKCRYIQITQSWHTCSTKNFQTEHLFIQFILCVIRYRIGLVVSWKKKNVINSLKIDL